MNRKFMDEAIRLAKENVTSGLGGPFGAVIVKDGKIIGRGVNRVTTNNDPTAHAEVIAIRDACKNIQSFQLENCEVYTTCEPCPMCLGAIYWARPEKVYYASTQFDAAAINFDDSFIYLEIEKNIDQRSIKFIPFMREEAQDVFYLWQNAQNKIEY